MTTCALHLQDGSWLGSLPNPLKDTPGPPKFSCDPEGRAAGRRPELEGAAKH